MRPVALQENMVVFQRWMNEMYLDRDGGSGRRGTDRWRDVKEKLVDILEDMVLRLERKVMQTKEIRFHRST